MLWILNFNSPLLLLLVTATTTVIVLVEYKRWISIAGLFHREYWGEITLCVIRLLHLTVLGSLMESIFSSLSRSLCPAARIYFDSFFISVQILIYDRVVASSSVTPNTMFVSTVSINLHDKHSLHIGGLLFRIVQFWVEII